MDTCDNRPIRVLLVEDDEDDYLLTRELLEETNGGYALEWISSYDRATEAMCRSEHDVYLLDYRLGGRNGLELLREAVALGCMGPAILLTGQGEREIDVEAMQCGAADYLEKGRVDAPMLERSIRYARERWKSQTELEQRVRERTAELTRVNEALQEADRRKDEFLATLAHELRNPLAPIRTGLEVMRIAGENPAMREEIRSTMERQVNQMVRLVDDLLDVSRITRGKLELRLRPVDLAEVVHDAVDATKSFFSEKRQQLSVELPRRRVVLQADPARMAQVLANLLDNAAKFTAEEGRIWLTANLVAAEEISISVRDTGVGIPAEMLEQIFEMFAQVDRPLERCHSGLGIGLTLVKSLVEMHRGAIHVSSEGPGRGSEFRLRLPVSTEAAAPDRQPLPEHGVPTKYPPIRVLVVDDNRAAADLLAASLDLAGNHVRTAYDGLQAFEAAEAFRPHLVLLDLGMPHVNGYDAARRIRRESWGRQIRLVALTGWGQAEDKERTRAAGFDQHLVKPVEAEALQSLFAELAGRGAIQD
jgi:signal transduction histidine kinase